MASTQIPNDLDDTLITPSGGERTAALVSAKLLMLEHIGHDWPEPLWPVMCDAVIAHAAGTART